MTTADAPPPFLLPPPPDPPGSRLDPGRWVLTLPVAGPDGGPVRLGDPELASFADPLYFYGDSLGLTYLVAPAAGTPDVDGAPRCALDEADRWAFDDGADHVLTATVTVDLASLEQRCAVVAAVEDLAVGGGPAVQLLAVHVDQAVLPGRLMVVGPGGVATQLLGELDRDMWFSLRVAVTGSGAGRRCYVFAGYGEAAPVVPGASWPVGDFGRRERCGFTIGAVHDVAVGGLGKAVVRMSRLTLV